MIKVGSSFFRKFQFFEVVKDPEIISNNQPLKNSINKNLFFLSLSTKNIPFKEKFVINL